MEVVLDACTLINLVNSQVLHKISLLPSYIIYVSDILLEQEILNEVQKLIIEALIQDHKVQLLESKITLSEFAALKNKYDLGNGETECMAICMKANLYFASDDAKARKCAIIELGNIKVIGSLYLIREAVRNDLLTCEEALQAYVVMKDKGGFLPKVNEDYLCK